MDSNVKFNAPLPEGVEIKYLEKNDIQLSNPYSSMFRNFGNFNNSPMVIGNDVTQTITYGDDGCGCKML
jgi:hypothetical protein